MRTAITSGRRALIGVNPMFKIRKTGVVKIPESFEECSDTWCEDCALNPYCDSVDECQHRQLLKDVLK